MPLYSYKGTDKKGKSVHGMVAAVSRSQAHQKIKARQIFPTSIEEDMGGASRQAGNEDLAYTVMQLATLLKSGIPMDEALDSLSESAENAKLRRALARVRVRLREGESLSGSMTEDEIFPPMLVRMVGAGEEAGKPGEILDRYAVFLQDEIEHRRALQSALSYPIVLISMATILLIALILFLTPVIQEMYGSAGHELPAFTQIMVGLGNFLRSWGLITFLGIALVVGLIYKITPRVVIDRKKMTMPLLGPMVRAGLMSRWARTLGMLHGAGVPLVRALQMSREVVDNEALSRDLKTVEIAVERGEGLAHAMSKVYLVPPLLQQFLRTGERTGDLEPMLNSAAGFYEKELARRRTAMTRWLEPALILFMGVIVGMLVVSALLPLSQLAADL
ncbi:MAG: type II secretion system F family protein [bacterium]|nr:type II secretion system F family protein [bacterium]